MWKRSKMFSHVQQDDTTFHDIWKWVFLKWEGKCNYYNMHLMCNYILIIYVTLDHKTNHKSHRYICSNSQQYIVWVKIIDFSFMPKIIRILSS